MKKTVSFFVFLLCMLLLVSCAAPHDRSRPFSASEITHVALRYGADGGREIPLTDIQRSEIIGMLDRIVIDTEAGFGENFYGGVCCLGLTTNTGERMTVYLVRTALPEGEKAQDVGVVLQIFQEGYKGGAEPCYYPITSDVGLSLYEYCEAVGQGD